MTVSTIDIADAASPDKYLWTEQRTVSSTAREMQVVYAGESPYPTYYARASRISIATSSDHILMIQADGTNYSRLKHLEITCTDDLPASASVAHLVLYRTTTAGSGGSAVSVGAYDTADTYGGTVQTLPSSKGTEANLLYDFWLTMPASLGDTLPRVEWTYKPGMKPIIWGTSAASGLVVQIVTGVASTSLSVMAEFITTTYL